MKNKYSFLFILLVEFFSLSAGASLNLDSADEYEYLHCVSSEAPSEAIVQHFLIDVKNENVNAIYSATAVKSRVAKNITDWQIVDDDTQLVQVNNNFDLYIVSQKNNMTFSLNVMDDGGYSLSGTITSNAGQTELACLDISLEH